MMEKVVRFSKKSVKYTIAIVNWLIYSIIVIERMQNELLYLRQEVEFLKKIIIADNSRKKK